MNVSKILNIESIAVRQFKKTLRRHGRTFVSPPAIMVSSEQQITLAAFSLME